MLKKRAVNKVKPLGVPLSYRVLDHDKLYDCRNIYDNKGVQETRHGIKKYNPTSLGGRILSTSFFKNTDDTKKTLAKVGSSLFAVAQAGASTAIKTGLNALSKHRGVTLRSRHILAIENDGLFSYNGTTVTQLGQAAPSVVTIALASGGAIPDSTYGVYITFYSSSTGFESNASTISNTVAVTGANKKISVTGIPATAANTTIDKVRIYLRDEVAHGPKLFVAEVALGATHTIDKGAESTQTPPTKNAPPQAGGAKFLAEFGDCLAYAGNATYPNDVFISEANMPDAYDDTSTAKTLFIPGQGAITGLAVGFYDESNMVPYLVIFKKSSTTIYSEINGNPSQVTIDKNIGCVSADTIREGNGLIYFMSENGWYAIRKGSIIKNSNNLPVSLGNGDIDDIFSRVGWTYELNTANFPAFFSAYYKIDSHYMTFISEGSNNQIKKAYVFEEKINGFRVFEFKSELTCACEGETDEGYPVIFFGDATGTLYYYSSKNAKKDVDENGNELTIPAYFIPSYFQPGDDAASYNFRSLLLRSFGSVNEISVKAYPSFSMDSFETFSYGFPNSSLGFTLDVSQLDVDTLDGERIPVSSEADLSLTGEVLLVGFYQDVLEGNMGLISVQLTSNKNGSRNL